MKCSNCGNELKDTDLFCGKCGNKIIQDEEKNSKKGKFNYKEKKKIIFVIAIIVVIIVSTLIIRFMKLHYNEDTESANENVAENKGNIEKIEEDPLYEKYMKVLSGEEEFYMPNFSANNEKYTLKEWVKSSFSENIYKIKYCIFDIDNDNLNEMYVVISMGTSDIFDDITIILNEKNDNLYGFYYEKRGIMELKTDGTYLSSSGASYNVICKTIFDGENSEEITLASQEDNVYMIDNKEVTAVEYNKVLQEFNNKENIQLVEYIVNESTTEEKSANNTEDITNDDKLDIEFSNDIIKDRVENSYSRLIDDINSYNITMAIKNQDKKILAIPQNGKVYALYNKQNDKIQYIQYYGAPFGGTEIIWIDLEGAAEYSVFEGQYGEKVMKPYIIRAINVYGNVIDRRNESIEFSVNSAIIKMIKDKDQVTTEEGKEIINAYVLKEFNWSVDSKDGIILEQIN